MTKPSAPTPRAANTAGLLALTGLAAVVRAWPRSMFAALAAAAGVLAKPFGRKEAARLSRNVARAYDLPARSVFARDFGRQVARHQIRCALETLRVILQPSAHRVVGLEDFRAKVAPAEAAGRGHIIVTAHLGSWELCAYYGQKAATRPFHVLAKPSRSSTLTVFLDRLRARMGTPVLWTDRKTILRDMLGALKRAESVGFVMDQKPEGRHGPVVPFFGIDTEFVSGPASMAVRTGAAVVALFCVRTGPFEYRLLSEVVAPPGHEEKDELALTARMAAVIERAIRLYPEQLTWGYKRWRE